MHAVDCPGGPALRWEKAGSAEHHSGDSEWRPGEWKKEKKKETGSTFCVNIYLVVGVPFGPCAVFHNTPANLNLSLPHDSLAIPNPISIL